MTNEKLRDIPSLNLFTILSVYESAHEPDQKDWAETALKKLDCTYQDAVGEFRARERAVKK